MDCVYPPKSGQRPSAFQQGRTIPSDILESFSISLELVYRELLAKESLEGTTIAESETCECVRLSLDILANMSELNRMNELQFIQTEPIRNGQIGRPKFCISQKQLSMLLEHRFRVPQIADLLGVSVSTKKNDRLQPFCICYVCYDHF